MVYGGSCGFTCKSQCPPHQAMVQSPPFCITVPGPILSCYNDTLGVSCNAPCGYGCGGAGWGGYGDFEGYGGYGMGGFGHGFGRGGHGGGARCAPGYGVRGY